MGRKVVVANRKNKEVKNMNETEEMAWRRELEAVRLEMLKDNEATIAYLENCIKQLFDMLHMDSMPEYCEWPTALYITAASIALE